LRATEGSEAISFFSSETPDCFVASLLAMTNPDFFSSLLKDNIHLLYCKGLKRTRNSLKKHGRRRMEQE
jgi:hypothetical protein